MNKIKIKNNIRDKIANSVQDKSFDNAQDRQDEIFRRMSTEKKVKLASDFSMFILRLHKLKNQNGLSRIASKNLQGS